MCLSIIGSGRLTPDSFPPPASAGSLEGQCPSPSPTAAQEVDLVSIEVLVKGEGQYFLLTTPLGGIWPRGRSRGDPRDPSQGSLYRVEGNGVHARNIG